MAEKPLISEETDLIEPSLLDELICHISSLASVYHRPPSSFVAGKSSQKRAALPSRVGGESTRTSQQADSDNVADPSGQQPTLSQMAGVPPLVAAAPPPTTDSLLGDLLELGPSLGGGVPPMQGGGDIFGAPMQAQPASQSMLIPYFRKLYFSLCLHALKTFETQRHVAQNLCHFCYFSSKVC